MVRSRACCPAFTAPANISGINPSNRSRVSSWALASNRCTNAGRCLTGVDSRSKGLSEFVAIDEESNDEIMHALRLGEAQRAADEPLDPGPQIDVFALD